MSYLSTLQQTATIEALTGTDDYSKAIFDTPTTIKCRVVLKGTTKFGSMIGRGSSSELTTVNAVARVPVNTQAAVGDRFTFNGDVYKVVGRRETPNHSGQIFALNLELSLWPQM
jgi:hypothetical protein